MVMWQQYLYTVATVMGTLIAVATYLDVRSARRQKIWKQEIKDSVTQLETILVERLETKDNVNQLRIDIAGLKAQMQLLMTKVGALWLLSLRTRYGKIC